MPDREKVIKGIRKCLSHKPCSENDCPYENECAVEHLNDPLIRDALALLKDQPQIVRCKDCKFGFSEYGYVFCTKPHVEKGSANHKPDWLCADGERK